MIAQTSLYLDYGGRTEEAIDFYKTALGVEVQMMQRFGDVPPEDLPPGVPPEAADRIMHAELKLGDHTLMLSDGMGDSPGFSGFSVSLIIAEEADLRRYFDALGKDGEPIMPPAESFWSPLFCSVKDKFGIQWMLTLPPKENW